MKVFLDTNVLVSALATRGLCAELFEVVLQEHELLISEPLMEELERILSKLGQSKSITDQYLSLLRAQATLVASEVSPPSLPDPTDEPVVGSALGGQADLFVTGDKALLELRTFAKLPIISPRSFWELLSRGSTYRLV